MARRLTAEEKRQRDEWFREAKVCWMCAFLGVKQTTRTTLHHIAGRGRQHERLENYCALSASVHDAIQSRQDAEVMCLVLKRVFDPDHFDPALICKLRGKAETWITELDVLRAERTMSLTRDSFAVSLEL